MPSPYQLDAGVIISPTPLLVMILYSAKFLSQFCKCKGGCDRIRTRDQRRPIVTLRPSRLTDRATAAECGKSYKYNTLVATFMSLLNNFTYQAYRSLLLKDIIFTGQINQYFSWLEMFYHSRQVLIPILSKALPLSYRGIVVMLWSSQACLIKYVTIPRGYQAEW